LAGWNLQELILAGVARASSQRLPVGLIDKGNFCAWDESAAGSFTVPRSEVFAFWLNAIVAQERIQHSIHLKWEVSRLLLQNGLRFVFFDGAVVRLGGDRGCGFL